MATWNKKQRQAMRETQAKFSNPKRQVLCWLCNKIHAHPVCKPTEVSR